MLYKSSVLIYDHQTETVWSQLLNKAIAGKKVGQKLKLLTSSRTTWKRWKKKHPKTLVLSIDTGYRRNYAVDPYKDYIRAGSIWFPVGDVRKDLKPKDMVLGIESGGKTRAWSVKALVKKNGAIKDKIGKQAVHIKVDNGEIIGVEDGKGNEITHLFSFWFAWQAAHPKTTVWK